MLKVLYILSQLNDWLTIQNHMHRICTVLFIVYELCLFELYYHMSSSLMNMICLGFGNNEIVFIKNLNSKVFTFAEYLY